MPADPPAAPPLRHLLAVCPDDEAQDLDPDKWNRDLAPMGATGPATRVLYGTP